jgi:hypothetical protein
VSHRHTKCEILVNLISQEVVPATFGAFTVIMIRGLLVCDAV